MSKKKEQVKFLKKSFASVVMAFEKEKNKEKRNEAFEFLTGRIAEFKAFKSGAIAPGPAEQQDEAGGSAQAVSIVQPSPALVDELRASHQAIQN